MSEVSSEQRLPIDKVLNGSLEGLYSTLSGINDETSLEKYKTDAQNILYASPINKSAVQTTIGNMKNLFNQGAEGPTTIDLITNMDTTLSATNSNKFYNGDVAKQKINSMKDIQGNVTTLQTYLYNELDTNDVYLTIDKYNEKLDDLRTKLRRELLEAARRAFNNKKIEAEPKKTKTYTYTITGNQSQAGQKTHPSQEFLNSDTYVYEFKKIDSSTSDTTITVAAPTTPNQAYNGTTTSSSTPTPTTTQTQTDTWEIYKYKFIKNTTNMCPHIQSPLDPSFDEIEQCFYNSGATEYIPYDKSLIKDKTKNNSWGWNTGGSN